MGKETGRCAECMRWSNLKQNATCSIVTSREDIVSAFTLSQYSMHLTLSPSKYSDISLFNHLIKQSV